MSWPKLLILDCDGVLVDSEPLACEADAAAVQIFGTKNAFLCASHEAFHWQKRCVYARRFNA